MPDEDIRQRIRMLVQEGELTCEDPEQTWAGTAQGAKRCAGCLEPILAPQVEMEAVLPSGRAIFLHSRCHLIWLEVCAEPAPDAKP